MSPDRITLAAMKNWLYQNGGSYQSEKILVVLSEFSNQTEEGKLNWDKAYLFKEDEAQYWYVPYYFSSGKYTTQNGEYVKFGMAFKLQNKKVSDAMFSHDVYGKAVESLETGNISLHHIQTYKPLKGNTTTIWKADNHNKTATRLYKTSLTKEQIMHIRNTRLLSKSRAVGGSGLLMSSGNVEIRCETYTYTVTEDCTDYTAPPGDAVVVCARTREITSTVCIDVPVETPDPGTPGSGGGSGPAFPYNPGNNENNEAIITIDPCAKAKKAKEYLESLLNSGKFDNTLNLLTEGIGTAKDEKWMGFGVNENGELVPTNIKTGNGAAVAHIGYPGNDYPAITLIGDSHTHPLGLGNSHSAADVYVLAEFNNINSRHIFSLVYGANGSRNLLYIYDANALKNFVQKYPEASQVNHLNKGAWNVNEDVGSSWYNIITSLYDPFSNNKDHDTEYAKMLATAAVLAEFNTGIIMLHGKAGEDFKPVIPDVYQNPATGKYEVKIRGCDEAN